MPKITFQIKIAKQLRPLFSLPLTIKLTGSAMKLGLFNPNNAVKMIPNENFSTYSITINLLSNLPVYYKVFIFYDSEFIGEEFAEHTLIVRCLIIFSSYLFFLFCIIIFFLKNNNRYASSCILLSF